MLKNLTVWNFALIEHIHIDFQNGLNILTGETGAGKSILIDSVGIILGARASAEQIRQGADWLRVEAVFDTAGMPEMRAFLEENSIVDDDAFLIISRKIMSSGRNVITVNGCHITLTLLKRLGEMLVDIHGQHENQALLRLDSQFALLDSFDLQIDAVLQSYQKYYKRWRELTKLLSEKEQDSRQQAQRQDMLVWQIEEIENAGLKAGEEEALTAELKILANAEKIAVQLKRSYHLLEENERGHLAVIPALAEIKKYMEDVSRFDKRLDNVVKMLAGALCELEECSLEIRTYGEDLDYDEMRLQAVEARLDTIYKLRKKYGATVEDVLHHYEQAKQELAEIENYDEIVNQLKAEIQSTAADMHKEAVMLTKLRQTAAAVLSSEICAHLKDLGMANAQLQLEISPTGKYNQNGTDMLTVFFSGNAGEAMRPMAKVASGGELSRIALAIKAVCAARDKIGVMIFDEIDTGIGGRTAQMVAEKIALVALHKQVLCITHLPQIACMADQHLYIEKTVAEGKTKTLVRPLSTSGRINELARMASGNDVTAASLDNALEMLDTARRKREGCQSRYSA